MPDATYQPKVYRKLGGDELVVASGGKITQEPGGAVLAPVVVKTGNYTVLASESGTTFIADAADIVFTLPPTAAGLKFTFICAAVSAGVGLSVSPDAADNINEGVANKDLINSGATDVLGDAVELVATGIAAQAWYTKGKIGTWAAEA